MTIHQILSRYWGYSNFRPLQEDIILSVLDGHDTLALMPTGGGKSICFQVPAMLNPGICIVVSPLIALMRDQVENLTSRDIKAIAVVSGMGKREIDIALDNCIYGDIKFLYLSPERLLSELVRERIRHMQVNLIAVDEAHCISQWGYDFRPPYLEISRLRELHPHIPVLALTATATRTVIADIQDKLAFKRPAIFRKSFERRNLAYLVYNEENKFSRLLNIANKLDGTGVVYVRNRRETQEIARQLQMSGISAEFYHAGLDGVLRTKKQAAWKNSEVRVMVATNAFGMGIDKADVRFVVHLDLPESLEAYYQEAGRAGRDEKKAFAVLLYSEADKIRLRTRLEQSYPSVEEIRQVYHQLGNYFQLAYGAGEGLSLEFDLADFCSRFGLEPVKTLHCLKFLEHDGYISVSDSVYLPSRLKMLPGPEDVYRFQVGQPAYDHFLKILLRSYGGIYDQFVNIKESDLARRMGMRITDVVDTLQKLQAFEMITYMPQTDKPLLTYLRPRYDTQHLALDHRYLAERFKTARQQVDAVIAYAETSECRSIQLLAYFDDHEAATCGICDVCLERNTGKRNRQIEDEIIKDILNELTKGPKHLPEIVSAVKRGNGNKTLEIIRLLLDSGKVKSNGDIYYLPT